MDDVIHLLIVIFIFVVVLVAMDNRAKAKRARSSGMDPGDVQALDRALDQARRLEQRIESLERVLDEDMPGWRRKVSA